MPFAALVFWAHKIDHLGLPSIFHFFQVFIPSGHISGAQVIWIINHLWIVSFHQVFISNRPIIDMDVIIFLDGFDILGNGIVHSVQSLNGYSFSGHQNKPFIVYFLRSEFLSSVIFFSKFQVQQHIFCSSQYQVQHSSVSPG